MLTLKKNYEFQRTLKKGKWCSAKLINMYIDKNNKESNYIGIAVGKKVSKSSVKRNRIRRIIREAYRLNESKIEKGFNIVMVWKTSCAFELASFHEIEKDILYCFKKTGILLNNDVSEKEEDENV